MQKQADEDEGTEERRPRHPIGVVENRTGLTSHTLRAWERRYGVVEPARSEGGHRLYSDADVERLRLLHELTRRGRRIGRIADRSTPALKELLAEDRAGEATAPGARPREEEGDVERVAEFLAEARVAVESFQAERLDSVLRRAALTLDVASFVDRLVSPLLDDIGRAWAKGELRPAHEHVASAIVIRVTGWLLESFEAGGDAPCLVVGTLAGDRHELGALSAAVTGASEGWRVRYLGPDLPVEEMALAAREVSADAVVLSMVFSGDGGDRGPELSELRKALPAGLPIVAGGRASGEHAAALEEIDAVRLDGFRSLRAVLRRLRKEREAAK